MSIKNFRDLNVWQESIKLVKDVYIITKEFPPEEKYNLTKHLKESSRGTAANIAEGFGRYFYKEKLQFYGIARGCLNEVINDIEISYQTNLISNIIYTRIINQTEIIGKMLNSMISGTVNQLN